MMTEDATPPKPRKGIPAWLATVWGKVVTVAVVLATAIGVVGIVVAVTEAAGRNDTTVGSISVESQQVEEESAPRTGLASVDGVALDRYEGDPTTWAVPVDAPFGEFMTQTVEEADDTGCTPSQLAWLKEHGVPYGSHLLRVDLINTATSGSRLVVSDIRPEGELTAPETDVVMVSCQPGIGGEPLAQFATLALGTGEQAVFGDIQEDCITDPYYCWYAGTGETGVPGTPVIFDIAPGEAAILVLRYDHAVDFRGRFVATVSVDGVESTLVLTPNGEDIYAPVITIEDVWLTSDNGVPGCLLDVTGPNDCTADWASALAAAATR
jgi:hypothetical protein